MLIETWRFGRTEIAEDSIIAFSEGILGFEELKRFAIILSDACEPIQWLQSMDDPRVSLPIINPFLVAPDYELDVDDSELYSIGKPTVEDILVVNVMVLPEDITKTTVNLSAPILINVKTRQGRQIVMDTVENGIRYPAFAALAAYFQEEDEKERTQNAGADKKD